jgi:hypothetical protein
MAKTSNQKGNKAAKPDAQGPLEHERFGLQQFRLGPDKKWHFVGQEPDEVVRMLVRKHWWFLVLPALPFAGAILLLFLVLGAAAGVPAPPGLWFFAEVVVFLVVIGTGLWFVYSDLVLWWFETYIITNKRIINSTNLLQVTRKEVPLEKVQQVGINFKDTPFGFILGYGTVHVYLTGDQLIMKDVPDPRRVKDAIQGVSDDFKAKKKPEQPIPKPKDPDMLAALEDLAKQKPVPKLPDADERYPPLRNPDRLRGPRRKFGILRVPAEIRYFSGEFSVKYIQRSRYVLYRNLALPALILLLILPAAVIMPSAVSVPSSWWLFTFLGILGILLWMAIVYVLYIDDLYILTNRRVIDIERELIFTFESRAEAEYKNIREVRVLVTSVFKRFLDVGDVYIQTPGNSPDITFLDVDHPFLIQDLVLGIKDHKDKEDKVNKENEEKKKLNLWLSTMFAKLEETNKSRGAPDLKDMDLLSAIYCVQEMELEVEVLKEDVPNVPMEPGRVIYQNPPAGTLMNKGSKIEVVLSKR